MSRFLLVTLADDLAAHFQTRTGAFRLLGNVPGVESVTDLDAISQATLDMILLKPTPLVKQEEPKVHRAIREHHQRRRQPRLDL